VKDQGCFVAKEDLREMNQYARLAPMSYDVFNDYYRQVMEEDGVLSKKVRELVAIGAAHAAKCSPCIYLHTEKAKRAGATKEEITEAIFVASLIGAASALTHGTTALRLVGEESDDESA
jgi:AhpD family alkylhydroperoxidase